DLWKYCVVANKWIWEGGDSTANSSGSWGTKSVSNSTNKPSGRNGPVGWTDGNWHLYLFGGCAPPVFTNYNDLWEYAIDSTCGVCPQSLPRADFTPADTTFCIEGVKCIDFYDHSTGNPTSWQWKFPGAMPDTSSQQNPSQICYGNPGTYAVTLIVTN